MKNTGKSIITGLVIKAALIACLLFALQQIYAKEINPEVITTTFPEVDPGILEKVDRFYEISESSLRIGYNVTINMPSAFKVVIDSRERYITISNITDNEIILNFLGSGKVLSSYPLKNEEYVIFKIENLNLQFILDSTNYSEAKIRVKLFEHDVPKDVDYFELFDIEVKLAEYTIYSPTDLLAIVEFTNFGEGPSHTRLIYSIIDKKGMEYYTSIDEKVVETDEVVIKKFDTLKIPNGQYTIRTTIYYGKNQEATSEQDFILTDIPKAKVIKQPAIFISIIFLSFIVVIFIRKMVTKK